MYKRQCAGIIFYDDKAKRILLQDRKGISKFGEEWAFFGGGIELGEVPEQALRREIIEELSFELKEFKFFKKISYKDANLEVTAHFFMAPLNFSLSLFNQKEGDDMKLFPVDEALNLKMAPWDEEILEELKNYFLSQD